MCCFRGPHQGVSHEEYARLPHAGNLRLGRQLGSVTASPAASCIGWRKWIPGDEVRGGGSGETKSQGEVLSKMATKHVNIY